MRPYLLAMIITIMISIQWVTMAVEKDPFVLIPDAKSDFASDVEKISDRSESPKFWNTYNTIGKKYAEKNESSKKFWCDLWSMLWSGIVTWDTLLCLLIRVVKFVANMALVVWSAMVIYAGYLYVSSVYTGDQSSTANNAIKDAAFGIVIVIFSYAIERIITQAFLN